MKAVISKLKNVIKTNNEDNYKINKIEKIILLVFWNYDSIKIERGI